MSFTEHIHFFVLGSVITLLQFRKTLILGNAYLIPSKSNM